MKDRNSMLPAVWIGFSVTVLLGLTTLWILSNGYFNDQALSRWTQISTILGASELRLESIGLLYPHLPIYLLIPFYYLPGMSTPLSSYLLSTLIAGLLLSIWYRHLRRNHFQPAMAAILVLLVAAHPVFLWAVSTGTEKSLSLLLFYLMCLACIRMQRIGDLRAIIMLGGILSLFFFVDERTAFLFIALLPLLPFLAPLRMLKTSIPSTFILITLPVTISVLAWIYLNWLFHGDPLHFMNSPESAFIGATQNANASPWLDAYGGQPFKAFWLSLGLLLLSTPVFAWMLWRLRGRMRLLISVAILGLHPLLAAAIATQLYFSEHPLDFVFLTLAAFMAAVMLLPRTRQQTAWLPVVWLLASWAGGWLALSVKPTIEMQAWQQAFSGVEQPVADASDQRVGLWLAQNREITLIDSRSGYRIIAARGDAEGMWLPFMHEFKLAERIYPSHVEQIVVANPLDPKGRHDRITSRFTDLYYFGQPGYRLVLDDPPWRVYRRSDLPPPRSEALE